MVQNFYASLQGLSGGAELEKHVVHTMTMKKIEEEENNIGGEFLLFLAAAGIIEVIPKHHYMFHMTRKAEEDGIWLDCFVHERKHQLIKDCSDDIKNTQV